VVGFDSSGISEMIQTHINGILTPLKDTDNLRIAITELLTNTEKREKIAGNCRESAVKLCSPDIYAVEYQKLYESIIRNNRHASKK
jgi:glycosyltransferase involved in cell wall biosynthesis